MFILKEDYYKTQTIFITF